MECSLPYILTLCLLAETKLFQRYNKINISERKVFFDKRGKLMRIVSDKPINMMNMFMGTFVFGYSPIRTNFKRHEVIIEETFTLFILGSFKKRQRRRQSLDSDGRLDVG